MLARSSRTLRHGCRIELASDRFFELGLRRCTEGSILRGLHYRAERAVVCLHGLEEIAKQTQRP